MFRRLECLGLVGVLLGMIEVDGAELQLFGRKFSLNGGQAIEQLVSHTETLIHTSLRQEEALEQTRAAARALKPPAELTLDELKQLYHEPDHYIGKKERRGLEEIRRLAIAAAATPQEKRAELTQLMTEVADAINNNDRSPMPERIELSFAPFILLEYLYRPIGVGREAASNLQSYEGDLSKADPLPSSFWKRPDSISSQNLNAGFGRSDRPAWESKLWIYSAPKTSLGTVPGFEAVSEEGRRIKIKFREAISEPFTARIFAALGYNVDPTDHAPYLKLKYDRRLLKEFHLRKDAFLALHRFGIRVMSLSYQQRYDPFDYIATAVLTNGSSLSGQQLKQRLFHKVDVPYPEDDPDNFRAEMERQIDYFVTVPANVQPDDGPAKSIGPWDFNHLGHSELRELRGLCLLAAWVGWCDARFDNTRLKVVRENGQSELRHYLSDLGAGLGKGTGFVGRKGESAQLFPWTFTRPAEVRGRHEIFLPFRIVNYAPVDDNAAFEAMTLDDARWMARLIGQLTERQLVHALEASGVSGPDLALYTAKLANRRDTMIRHLKLELPPLRDITAHRQSHRKS